MLGPELKAEFIRLRAEGKSYNYIAKELHIAKKTCTNWERELREAISDIKQDQLNALYAAFHMKLEGRIRKLGATLERIEDALDKVDLSEVPPERLLDYKLKYMEALKNEYLGEYTPVTLSDVSDPHEFVNVLSDLLNRIRAGEVTQAQAAKESTVLTNLLKAYEITDVKRKLDALESILEGRAI